MPAEHFVMDAVMDLWASLRRNGFWGAPLASLRSDLCHVVARAVATGVPPERLLVLVKGSWRDLPEVANATQRYLADERRDRIVSMCIDAYYDHATSGDDAVAITKSERES